MATHRRQILQLAGSLAVIGCRDQKSGPANGPIRVQGKAEDLLLLTDRPVNVETPLSYFRHDLTPNEAFFVRWHLPTLPTKIDRRSFRLALGGHVEQSLELALDELESMDGTEIVAVNQCSGNGRALFSPRVPGLQWTHGGMGNARWKGVPLRTLLDRAGVKIGAKHVSFSGLDAPPMPSVQDFVKSIPIDVAREGEVLVAYAMNDAELPIHNGFPLRLVVPGYYSTYWIKALDKISVLTEDEPSYWMQKAYRIPATPGAAELPGELAKETVPIARMNVRSLVINPAPAESLPAARETEIEGIAFDGGTGIQKVEVSTDAGVSWTAATLDPDLGRFSWRRWRLAWTPQTRGPVKILCRASSVGGETQPAVASWNRAGYMRNVIETREVSIT